MFLKIGVLKNFANFTGKHICWSLFFNKVAGLGLQLYQKRDSNTGVFMWNLLNFLEHFFTEHLQWLFLKFDTLHILGNYVRSVYYNTFPLTLCFQVQFIKLQCTSNAWNVIKYKLKKEAIVSKAGERFASQKRRCHNNPERKNRQLKRDIVIRANQ